jgi:hypothetical protein
MKRHQFTEVQHKAHQKPERKNINSTKAKASPRKHHQMPTHPFPTTDANSCQEYNRRQERHPWPSPLERLGRVQKAFEGIPHILDLADDMALVVEPRDLPFCRSKMWLPLSKCEDIGHLSCSLCSMSGRRGKPRSYRSARTPQRLVLVGGFGFGWRSGGV